MTDMNTATGFDTKETVILIGHEAIYDVLLPYTW